MYEHPSVKLVTALAQEAEYQGLYPTQGEAENAIIQRYKAHRHWIQTSADRYFKRYYPVISHAAEHPFITWRTNVLGTPSRMKFCIILALHPAPVGEYEKARRAYMPAQLVDALRTAGVGDKQLTDLNIAGALYYDRMKHTNKRFKVRLR